jgi:steroid delta-isomerase-like uncharacterized protein
MAREDIEAAFARGVAAWNAHDADRLAAEYAAGAVVRDNGDPEVHGREGAKARAQMFMTAFPDLRIEVFRHEIVGNTICEEWRATGTHEGELMGIPATHRFVETLGASFSEVDDEAKIVTEHVYWDVAKFMRDLGVLPEEAGAPATA